MSPKARTEFGGLLSVEIEPERLWPWRYRAFILPVSEEIGGVLSGKVTSPEKRPVGFRSDPPAKYHCQTMLAMS